MFNRGILYLFLGLALGLILAVAGAQTAQAQKKAKFDSWGEIAGAMEFIIE